MEASKKTPKLQYAFELVQELRKSGTGIGRLELLREFITRSPKATAEDALAYMHQCGRFFPPTLEKATALVYDGKYTPPAKRAAAALTIEDELAVYHKQARDANVAKLAGEIRVPGTRPAAPIENPEDVLRDAVGEISRLRDEVARLRAAEDERAKAAALAEAERIRLEDEKRKAETITAEDEKRKAETEAAAAPAPAPAATDKPKPNGSGKPGK